MIETISVDPVILLYAFRYALGRMSYAVSDVADTLISDRDAFTADQRQQIVQDIHNAIEGEVAGQASDILRWQQVAKVMSE